MNYGRWLANYCFGLYQTEERFICSECDGQNMKITNYCPKCGARMINGGSCMRDCEELQTLIDEKVRVLHELMAKREQIAIEVDNELNELHELRYKLWEASQCVD